jgi:serine/threonine protein kinase
MVHQAVDITSGDLVAVKFVQAADDSVTDKIFEREVKTLGAVQHPNVVRLYGSGRDKSGRRYIALEWIERSLGEVIRDLGPFSWSDALEIYGLPLASALASAHLKGVEHRDIKPGNILVRANGGPVLADFGIGKLRGPDPTSLTVANYRSGVYAPPEFSAPSRTCRSSSAWDSSCSVGCCCSWPGA